jgi:hypothetical protein
MSLVDINWKQTEIESDVKEIFIIIALGLGKKFYLPGFTLELLHLALTSLYSN